MDQAQHQKFEQQDVKLSETEERHKQNLEGLLELLKVYPEDARFKNPNDPNAVSADGQAITLSTSEIIDLCGPYIAHLPAEMAFGVFAEMYVQPTDTVVSKLGQQAVSQPE